ncbi:LCP family protein [Lederbergia citri]|uniref:LCP family protein n=1 Tax=Lederbergia citri TaxID=2833580 RepID=A0A942YIU7_9BACI|nr:LCP family protein [Lederbergia citri]MBS4195726.1 LCP family protein [Lederbergia citri]
MEKNTRHKNNTIKKRKKRIKKIVLLFFLLLTLGISYLGYLAITGYTAANNSYEELDRGSKSKLRENEVVISEDPFSILIMGVEDYSSGGENGRTDTLLVATLNPKDQTMKMLSIPRDTRVEIAERGTKDKINHAHAFGGKKMTVETVENFLDIPIDYYVTVNFDGFKNIIDELNGITVDVPFDFWEKSDVVGSGRIYFKKGEMTLNGEEALAYARMRKRDPMGDMGRNERQQQIVSTVIEKLMSPSSFLKLDNIAVHIGNNVETNVKVSEALSIAKKLKQFNSSKIEKLTLTGKDEYINDIYYFIPDETNTEEVIQQLKQHLKQ